MRTARRPTSRITRPRSARTLSFAAGETLKTFNVIVADDAFVEPPEAFNLSLSNPAGGAGLGAPSAATVTITSDDTTQPTSSPSG